MQAPNQGVFVPVRVARRMAEGQPTVIVSGDPDTYMPGVPYLVADTSAVIGVATFGAPVTAAKGTVIKLEHGYAEGGMAGMWPGASELTSWPVTFRPLAERLPIAVHDGLTYGATFKIGLEADVWELNDEAVAAVREAKRLAKALAQGWPFYVAKLAERVGPATRGVLLATGGVVARVEGALARLPVTGGTRAVGDDPGPLVDALAPLLAKAAAAMPEGTVREALAEGAACLAVVAEALPLVKRSMPTLKLPDPVWAVRLLAAGKEAGFLTDKPRAARRGMDQLMVNEVQAKPGMSDTYARPFAWAIVRTGEPRQVTHDDLPGLPLDDFTRDEWKGYKGDVPWFVPLSMVRPLDPPAELRQAPPGRRFGSAVDLDTDAVEKAGDTLPDPTDLSTMKPEALRVVHRELVARWERDYQGNDRVQGREALINSVIFTRQEFQRRGLTRPEIPTELDAEIGGIAARKFTGRATAPINSGSGKDLPPITLAQVLEHVGKPALLRRGVVTIVGSVCNQGATHNDVDVLLQGPMDEALRRVIEFRVGRMFPGHISQRLSFIHDPELGGPFTDHVEAFDLALVPKGKVELVEMRAVEKANDPLLDMPPKRGPRPAVLQLHFRGRTMHGDFRIKVGNDYLVGWTMLLQEADIPAPADVDEARRMAREFDPAGGKYNKPFLAPDGIQAVPKSRQPVGWLHVEGQFIEPGEVGATRNLPGLIVEVPDAPEFAEVGVQKPYFHEYFLTGGSKSKMTGRLMFRQLPESEQSEGDGPFWRAILSNDYLPSVLEPRSAQTGTMPPDGYSWLPVSLERVTPAEFRYWERKGDEARKVRDALVASRFFTRDNVRLVEGQFARIEESRKYSLYVPDGMGIEDVLKQPTTAQWSMVFQGWKGQTAVRGGPSREVWRFALDEDGKLRQWELQTDPLAGQRVTAILKPLKGRALWEPPADVEPGKAYDGDVFNDTKATPSAMERIDSGTATVLESSDGSVKLRLRGREIRGVFALQAEEDGGSMWLWERSEGQANKTEPDMEPPTGATRPIAAIAWDRQAVADSPGAFNLSCAVGPVPDPERWQEVVAIRGESYTVIGATAPAVTSAMPGDVVVADVSEVRYERDARGRKRLRWIGFPGLATPEPVDRKPYTADEVIDVLQEGEIKAHVDTVIRNLLKIVSKAEGEPGEDRCYVFGEVLVPNIGTGESPDTQGDTYTRKDVEEACFSFMRHGHKAGLMHRAFIDGKVILLENYLMPMDASLQDMAGTNRAIPAGTWMMRLEVTDPDLKAAVRGGKLTGFSVGGAGVRVEARP